MPARRDPVDLATIGYALLSLLAREPSTGYRLAARLKNPIGFFWEAGHSQVYPQLAILERRGFVSATNRAGPGPRPTRTYTITRDGLDALRGWVGVPTRRWGGRDELLLKVYASWVAEPAATIKLLREAEAHHAAQLAGYLKDRDRARAAGADAALHDEPAFAEYATLRRGIGHERGRLAWCRWLIHRLEAEPGARRAGRPRPTRSRPART
jgi:DNA-binding PadR family transcriptional regulator